MVECSEAGEDGARVTIDVKRGELRVGECRFAYPRCPAFILEYLEDGDLITHIAKSPPKNS